MWKGKLCRNAHLHIMNDIAKNRCGYIWEIIAIRLHYTLLTVKPQDKPNGNLAFVNAVASSFKSRGRHLRCT